ncbi:MAG: hypothetical protein P8Y37_11490 [Anaerolineales bacterium]
MNADKQTNKTLYSIPVWFLAGRMILLLSLPIEGLKSYGDFWNFFNLAAAGWPYLQIWVEFPPIFPFLSRIIYLAVGGKEHAYVYILAMFFSIVQAVNIYLFIRIAEKSLIANERIQRTVVYSMLLVGLFYGWAYFDSLGVFFLLLSIYLSLRGSRLSPGFAMGLGGLVKWFPVFVFPASVKWRGAKNSIRIGLILIATIVIAWGLLYAISPEFVTASLVSQTAKGSWETAWAIIDGNFGTGNFNVNSNRFDALTATLPAGNPSRISPLLTLPVFLLIGLFVFLKAKIATGKEFIAFSGFTMVLFLLWAPGYSPQWMLYLLPLVLLRFDQYRGILVGLVLVLINLLEWPIILSRGLFNYLSWTILLRTFFFVVLAVLFVEIIFREGQKSQGEVF